MRFTICHALGFASVLLLVELIGRAQGPGPIGLGCGDGCDSALFIKRVYPDNGSGLRPTPKLFGVSASDGSPCLRRWIIRPANSNDPSGQVVARTCYELANEVSAGFCEEEDQGDQKVKVTNPASKLDGDEIMMNCYVDPANPNEPGECVKQPSYP